MWPPSVNNVKMSRAQNYFRTGFFFCLLSYFKDICIMGPFCFCIHQRYPCLLDNHSSVRQGGLIKMYAILPLRYKAVHKEKTLGSFLSANNTKYTFPNTSRNILCHAMFSVSCRQTDTEKCKSGTIKTHSIGKKEEILLTKLSI